MRSLAVLTILLVAGSLGCGQLEATDRAAIPDAQLAELREQRARPEASSAPARAGRSFYLRLQWGELGTEAARPTAPEAAAALGLSEGTVVPVGLLAFRQQPPHLDAARDGLSWKARLDGGFQAATFRIEVPRDDALIALSLGGWQRTFRASELTGGDEASFSLDRAGHTLSVSSLPASSCPGGFALGWVRPVGSSMAFAGRVTDRTGKLAGTIRFRAQPDGTLQGEILDGDGRFSSTVRGTLVQADQGGSFSAELTDGSGRDLGALTGLFDGRGAFQGSAEQVCAD